MARSPSPAGSYSIRRSRPENDRHSHDKRDDPRYARRRSRSPAGGDRRHYERDSRRDYDRRRGDDYHRSERRDRSRDRRRSPDITVAGRDRREPVRGEYRPRRDDSRDRHKRRRDDSTDSRSKRRKGDDKTAVNERSSETQSRESSRAPNKEVSAEEHKRLERLAKLEAWKQKQAAEKARKDQEAASNTPVSTQANDRPGTPSTISSPQSPAPSTEPQSPAPKIVKYDPKNIAKKAVTNAAQQALGADLNLPKMAKLSGASKPLLPASSANTQKALEASNNEAPFNRVKGAIGAFGLGQKAQQEAEANANKRNLNLDEEVSTRKKLERLPTPPPESADDPDSAVIEANEEEECQDEDTDMVDAGNEEESAAAARAAAEKREERLLAESQAQNAQTNGNNGDIEMTDTPAPADDEDENDPLEAFMAGLAETKAPGLGRSKSKAKMVEPQPMFENVDNELDAMDVNGEDLMEGVNRPKKKKDIPTVRHEDMNYETFRKNFYNEPSELANLTEAEVSNLRHELEGIKVRGVDVPKPVQKWSQCGLGLQSLEVIRGMGFEAPTAIQSQALPAIMSGRDVIGIAKTGSGKTIAFLLPMFRHIKDQRPVEGQDGPVGLVMTPTRELATQIHKECKPWLKALGLRAVCAYGGAPIKDQIADLKRGAEIIVCTPGRMIDLLAANAGRVTNLRRITYLVLDEADRMFDMGFEPQVIKIVTNIRPQRQTVLFSATFPKNMEALARKTLKSPIEIVVGGRSVVAPEITQLVEVRDENTKFIRLLELLGEIHSEDDDARSLIFVDRQESAEELMNAVMRKGYPCFSIHGGKDQYDRDSVISDFKAGIFPVMVATSVAARGLDVKQLKMVVNFDCPNHLEDYVHRAGRTGRAGNKGLAVTFITPEQERYSIDIKKALKQSNQDVPEDLQKLVDSFLEKVKDGKERASGLGFGGKGLERLDQERDAAKARERKTYRAGDDDAEDEEKEKEKEEEVKLEKADEIVVQPTAQVKEELTGLEAFDLDGKVQVHRREDAAPPTKEDQTKRINDAVAAINARLRRGGELRGNAPIDNKGPDAGAFHSTFEINDLPQKARWAVTNRTNVAKILEATGTSITTKGNFYASGKLPGPTEPPKLYILVEGDTEVVVTQAVSELRRLAKDGMVAAINNEARAPASGRYSVV